MDLPVFGFDETPNDDESRLILFWQTAGNVGTISYKVRPTLQAAISDNRAYLFSLGFKEIGALKDDGTIQVSAGSKKTNYGESQKVESNFVLVATKNGTGSNVNSAIAANGVYVDQVVIDVANGCIYDSRNLKIASGVKIQGSKTPEMSFKNGRDGFTVPLTAVKIVGTTVEAPVAPRLEL